MEKKAETQSFSELLDNKYGLPGSPERVGFDARSRAFRVGQLIRLHRERKNMTQEQLATRIGTHKSYISKVEKGSDITLTTLFKIFDHGLEQPIKLLVGEILD